MDVGRGLAGRVIATEGSVASPLSVTPLLPVAFGHCDTDVAQMVARYAGASLGLLAFSIVVTAGLIAQNPVTVTLSRSIFALFLFCFIGLVLGRIAQMVVAEHEQKRETEIRKRFQGMQASTAGGGPENRATEEAGGSIAS